MKKDGNHSSPQNNLIQDSEGNEENGYSVPASNQTKIKYAKKSKETHKNILKEEILQVITENFMEPLLDMVNQKVQEALKKLQDAKSEDNEKTQKQINELIVAFKNTKVKQRTL
jgi:hypothetical protein